MMFSNFIFNAIDAIELDDEDAGNIEMVYDQDEQFHSFTIYDSGVPIDDEKALFEAFKSSKEKGTGLGLVLSGQIARAHGGDISLAGGGRKGFKITLSKEHG
jgi:two-component system NtrC family sensor kinase